MVASPNVNIGGSSPIVNRMRGLKAEVDALGRHAPFGLQDAVGNTLYSRDLVAGYGFESPYNSWSFSFYDPPAMGTTGSTFYPLLTANAQVINPGVQASIALKLVSSTAATMDARWHIYDPYSGFSSYAQVQSLVRASAGTSYANSRVQTLLLPQAEINASMIVDLEARLSAGAGTAYAAPNYFVGAPAALVAAIGGWNDL